MKRREFIGIAAASAACAVCPVAVRGRDFDSLSILARPRVLGVLRDEQLLHVLGARYREMTPHERGASALVQAIMKDIDSKAATDPLVSLEVRMSEQVRRDFSAGRTVTLNGWILSVTEARQCALHSLVPVRALASAP
jgi:hypothetical protein